MQHRWDVQCVFCFALLRVLFATLVPYSFYAMGLEEAKIDFPDTVLVDDLAKVLAATTTASM